MTRSMRILMAGAVAIVLSGLAWRAIGSGFNAATPGPALSACS